MNKIQSEILQKIRSDNSIPELMVQELEQRLDMELKKKSPDYDLIEELSLQILESREQAVKEIDIQFEISKVKQKAIIKEKRFRYPKLAVAISVACLMIVCANTISVAAWGINIFSAIVEITKSGISIDFDKSEVIKLPTSEDDPYGIKEKCSEYGIEPVIPQYLPDGFELTEVTNEESDNSTYVDFVFQNGNQKISISFEKFSSSIPNIGVPSDNYNIAEIEINGEKAIISQEDNQYTAVYCNDNIVTTFFTQDVDYSECEKIIKSLD